MPNVAAWGFGLLTLLQSVWILMEWWANRSRKAHLRGVRDELRILREMCDEAGATLKGDTERQIAPLD